MASPVLSSSRCGSTPFMPHHKDSSEGSLLLRLGIFAPAGSASYRREDRLTPSPSITCCLVIAGAPEVDIPTTTRCRPSQISSQFRIDVHKNVHTYWNWSRKKTASPREIEAAPGANRPASRGSERQGAGRPACHSHGMRWARQGGLWLCDDTTHELNVRRFTVSV